MPSGDEISRSEYEGFFAESYDILQADRSDIGLYADLARERGSPVLDLGCGTGRVLLPLARGGARVVGLDASAAMLAVCRRKLALCDGPVRGRVKLVRADMTGFKLGRRFPLILLACNTVDHLVTPESRLQAFRRIRAHLTRGGRVVIDDEIPDLASCVKRDGRPQTFEFRDPAFGRRIVQRYTARYDFAAMLEHEESVLREYAGRKLIRTARARTVSALLFPEDLRRLLADCGFKVVSAWKNPEREACDAAARRVILVAARI